MKVLVIFILCIAVAICAVACSNLDQAIEYNNEISSRYADSFETIDTYDAPLNAVEYNEEKRINQKILLDTRIPGNHTLGIYAPKGEEIEITIDSSQINKNNFIVINPNLENETIVNLNSTTTKYTSEFGGIIEFSYNGGEIKENCTLITIKGCMKASCFRYGIDDEFVSKNVGKYITLDAANVRIYAYSDYVSNVEDATKTMQWWQNAIAFMDKSYNLSFYNNNFDPLKIYLTKTEYSYDVLNNIVYIPQDMSYAVLNHNALYSSFDAKLLDALKSISTLKVEKAQVIKSGVDKNSVAEIIASLAYAKFVDEYQANDNPKNYILKQSECLKKALEQNFENDKEKNVSLIMLLYYEVGEDAIVDALKEEMSQFNGIEDFIFMLSNAKQINTLDLMQLYGLKEKLSSDQIAILQNYAPIYLVANTYTIGSVENKLQTGLHFKIGQPEVVDFKEGIIAKDEWNVVDVKGQGWSKNEDGKYLYTPQSTILKDQFEVLMQKDGAHKTLIGNLTVDIDVAHYSLYSNIKYDALSATDKLEDAIKTSSSLPKSESKSLYSASVPKEEVIDTTSYSLAITEGCMQVDADGKYVFYLASSGLCKVVFGVEDHNFIMFENSLTVGEYTEELKYEITLQEGYKYYYTIYVLSNKGSGYANLAIKSESNPVISEVDRKYIITPEKKITRENIVTFNPALDIRAYSVQESVDRAIETKQVREKSNNIDIEQNAIKFEVKSLEKSEGNEKFILPLLTASVIDYLKINVTDMQQVTIKVTSGSDFSNVLIEQKLVNGDNIFDINYDNYLSEIKIEFISENPFDVNVNSLEIGEKLKEMEIVSSSSTDIEYIGEWTTSHSYIGMNNSVIISSSELSSINYKFNGDEISVYAVKDKNFGSATIYIDGKEMAAVDLASPKVQCAQLIFNAKLEEGDHVIEIKANGDSPITLDYFAVSKLGETQVQNDFSKLWYVVFIPAIIIIAGIVCISLDIKEKKKKKDNQ